MEKSRRLPLAYYVHGFVVVHDDVIKWKYFPRYWPFVWGIHRSPVNSPHKGQWGGALTFSFIYAWTNDWVNNRDAGDLRRHRAHDDVTVMVIMVILRFLSRFMWYIATLTHWGRVTHMCIRKRIIIGSDNGLSPGRHQAIIWINEQWRNLVNLTLRNKPQWNLNLNPDIFIQEIAFENIVCEMAAI